MLTRSRSPRFNLYRVEGDASIGCLTGGKRFEYRRDVSGALWAVGKSGLIYEPCYFRYRTGWNVIESTYPRRRNGVRSQSHNWDKKSACLNDKANPRQENDRSGDLCSMH